jgi:hypothetical protein
MKKGKLDKASIQFQQAIMDHTNSSLFQDKNRVECNYILQATTSLGGRMHAYEMPCAHYAQSSSVDTLKHAFVEPQIYQTTETKLM